MPENPFAAALRVLDKQAAEQILRSAMAEADPMNVIEKLVVPTMEEFGQGWDTGEIALSEIFMGSRLCEQLVMSVLGPGSQKLRQIPRTGIAVLQDHHMLGKRIVHTMLRASGYDVKDYGHVTVEDMVEHIQRDRLDILLISVLMLPAALRVRDLRDALDAKAIRLRILVGGAPFRFDGELWKQVGADAMGRGASDAIEILEKWSPEFAS